MMKKQLINQNNLFFTKLLVTIFLSISMAFLILPELTSNAATTEQTTAFKSQLTDWITTGNSAVHDISSYNLTFSELYSLYFIVAREQGVAYAVSPKIDYSYTQDSSGKLLTFQYTHVTTDFTTRYATLQKEVDKLFAGIDESMTDLEKVVFVHEYFSCNFEYDLSQTIPDDSYTTYGIFTNKTGVCAAYSKAFKMIMGLMDISCNFVASSSMDHSWVCVKLGATYYHIDPTWDDPIYDIEGRVFHKYLLLNSAELALGDNPHYGYPSLFTFSGTDYSNWEIHDVTSRLIYYNDNWYYVDTNNDLVSSDIMATEKTVIVDGGNDYNSKIYALEEYGDGWLYTKGNTLMYCDKDGSNPVEILQYDETEDYYSVIQYLYIEDNTLTATIFKYPTSDTSDQTVTVGNRSEYTFTLDELQSYLDSGTLYTFNDNGVIESASSNTDSTDNTDTSTSDSDSTSDSTSNDMSEYTQVEYIESTKSNPIDTGIMATSDTSVELNLGVTANTSYGNYLNGYTTSSSRLTIRQEASNGIYIAYGWYNSKVYSPEAGEQLTIYQNKNLTYINGSLVRTATTQTYSTSSPITLCGLACKIYGVKIWEGETLVRDFIPVTDSNNIACLYDNVSEEYFYGSDAFNAGSVVTDTEEASSEYTPVSYIQFDSNVPVDTDFTVDSNTSVKLDMALTSTDFYGNMADDTTTSSNRLTIRQESSNGLYVAYGWYNSKVYSPVAGTRFTIYQNKNLTYIDDTLVRTATPQTFTTSNTLKLGTSNTRIYGCTIWDNDILVHNYIPVLDKDGIACLYDLETLEYLYSSATLSYAD